MSDGKDPAIKLFGKTIAVPEIPEAGEDSPGSSAAAPSSSPSPAPAAVTVAEECVDENRPSSSPPEENDEAKRVEEEPDVEMESMDGKETEIQQGQGSAPLTSEEVTDPDSSSAVSENPTTNLQSSKPEEGQNESSSSQEKPLKKPDKILPCPRCNSMETKFCYYNNYNVNQPRHFCKNCQRYWTAGGTMRNVPVGAGRRKNKNLASHYRHITVTEALQTARMDIPNGISQCSIKPNGAVLAFGSDTPLCESMASVLNLAEKTARSCAQDGFHKPEEMSLAFSSCGAQDGDDHQLSGSVTDSSSKDEATKPDLQPVLPNTNGFIPQIPCLPGAPWPYPWNAAQWNSSVPPPAFCPAGFSVPFYPAPTYWGCTVPGTWNVSWLPQPTSPNATASSSGPNSPTLGKHSRDESSLKPSTCEDEPVKEKSSEKCFWIPKTLRIDDPGEAAKSSIWATLGIENDKTDLPRGKGLFKAFQSKEDDKSHATDTSPMLQANPAALSRSLNFQESS